MTPRQVWLPLLLSGALLTPAAFSQATPAASNGPSTYEGFSLPTIGGSLRYSLTASETVVTGYNGQPGTGVNEYTNVGGTLAYLSRSQNKPFSAIYSGGYLFGTGNFPAYTYQNLGLSQVLRTKNWSFVIADAVSYLPQTSVGGLSGVPGTGGLGAAPVSVGTENGIGILSNYGPRVDNVVSGTASRQLTGRTSLSMTGADFTERYIGNNGGINNDQQTANGTVMHQLDQHNGLGASYAFTNSTFSSPLLNGTGVNGYQTHTVQGLYSHEFNERFSLNLGVGPQWLLSSGGLITNDSVNVAASGALNYTGKVYSSSLSYSRSINNGNGVVIGSRSDVVAFTTQRSFGRRYQVAGLVGYNHSTSLEGSALPTYSSSGIVAGGQFTAVVHRDFDLFAAYTLQRQNFQGTSTGIADFNGLSNYITVGVTFSPPPLFTRK